LAYWHPYWDTLSFGLTDRYTKMTCHSCFLAKIGITAWLALIPFLTNLITMNIMLKENASDFFCKQRVFTICFYSSSRTGACSPNPMVKNQRNSSARISRKGKWTWIVRSRRTESSSPNRQTEDLFPI
jgi:hypothetical protein